MNITKLFEMQKLLDQHIQEKHNLHAAELIDKKILALFVELGELANETRCFKFWSLKGPAARQTILAEYVDGVHFILSLGIGCKLQATSVEVKIGQSSKEHDITSQFLKIYASIQSFSMEQSQENYENMFSDYLRLGNMLGFSGEDVEQAYVEKNQINYDRQKQGY
ncbi:MULTISPECIES: dUTP diphosphatase [Bacillaceae]|uniref:Dimeric dUTPase (All-alpha-NTP-PPase superfamily) n=1 Tax=Peribacillus huizhouensis TaxID=1501239 RepID=A0ABR6CLB0_9BACI|nr:MULTISPECIES: dUTP diphosphatase [Bacillaceae]MBA9025829.1 dimeric dUTPase (all-alpha-NTP-PPase superfamily) [Peribacillus huizhouensis]